MEISVTKPFYEELLIDAQSYDVWGQRIAGGEIIGKGIFYQDPLYPYLLGFIYSIFGHSIFAVIILQSFMGAASALLVFLVGARLVNKYAGFIAALLWAFHPPIIFYEGLLMKEGLAVSLTLLSIYALTMGMDTWRYKYWCLAGIALGLSALTRGNVLLFIPFVLLWLLIDDRRTFFKSSATFIAGFLIVIIPVAARNKLVGGEFVITTSQAGANFYWGNNEESTGTLLTAPTFVRSKPPYEKEDFANEAMRLTGRAMSDAEISRFWFKKGIEFIVAHPEKYIALQLQKLLLLINDTEISDNYQYYYYRNFSTVLNHSHIGYGLICSFGLLGMVLSIKNWRRFLFLYFFVFSYSFSLLLFLITTRYRLPMVPILTIFAGFAIYWIWERLSNREFSSFFSATSLLVVLSFFIWKDITWATHWNTVDVITLEGSELLERGDIDNAEKKFMDAVNLSPLDHDGHLGLGEVYFRKKRYIEAADEFKITLKEEPRSALVYNKIGLSYIYAGELDKGIEALRKSIELEPDQSSSYFGLSVAYGEKGLFQESEKYGAEFKRRKGEVADF